MRRQALVRTQREEPSGSWGGRWGFLGRDNRGGVGGAGACLAGMPGAAEMKGEAYQAPAKMLTGPGTARAREKGRSVRLPKRPQLDSKKSRVRTQLQAGASDGLGVCRVTKGQAAGLIKRCTTPDVPLEH